MEAVRVPRTLQARRCTCGCMHVITSIGKFMRCIEMRATLFVYLTRSSRGQFWNYTGVIGGFFYLVPYSEDGVEQNF